MIVYPALLAILCLFTIHTAYSDSRIMVISDPHYLSDSLYQQDNAVFLGNIQAMDGRITQYSRELMDALVRQAAAEQPDALIITGDLSFDGEKASHMELAAYFRQIEDLEIPVWVIPGNHDINAVGPVGFDERGTYPAENVSEEEFIRLYCEFLGDIHPQDGIGLSYAVRISPELQILMIDVSCHDPIAYTNGAFTSEHAAWVRSMLSADGLPIQTITASHHNLLIHSTYRTELYTMYGNQLLIDLMDQNDIILHLSGHLHIQHVQHRENITDAAIQSFCIFPHSYAILTHNSQTGEFTYEVKSVDQDLLPEGFLELSEKWFDRTANVKQLSVLLAHSVPSDAVSVMLDLYDRLHKDYYMGNRKPDRYSIESDPGYALWKKYDPDDLERILALLSEEDQRFFRVTPSAAP